MMIGTHRYVCQLLWCGSLLLLLAGCAGVKVSSVSTTDYMTQRRGDILTTGQLSTASAVALQILGIKDRDCQQQGEYCRTLLINAIALNNEQRLSALSELWLREALLLEKKGSAFSELATDAYINSVRYAYAYLFFTERTPEDRTFEDRQTQVRDYYNYAAQQAITLLFQQNQGQPPLPTEDQSFSINSGRWTISGDMKDVRLAFNRALPKEIIPAASLSFDGIRNQYRRDGFGAELVAVTAKRVLNSRVQEPFSETPFPAITGIMSFSSETLQQLLDTQEVKLHGYDPYRRQQIELSGRSVPLAANFTSGYGLWLARSGFARQALKTLVGRGEPLEEPRIYLMQPYDPDRRVIIMLHGLGSSPEAWINMANEVLGDEVLRRNYQIWQVYYPTNVPIVLNHHAIRDVLAQTLQHFDPSGSARASKDAVLVGHSMGGVIARLMVSSSEHRFWDELAQVYNLNDTRLKVAREKLDPYLSFEPLPQVSRAVFIAAPHRGTPFAERRIARWISGLVTLPASVLGRLKDAAQLLIDPASASSEALTRPFNSIDNLSERDMFIRISADMPISPSVHYHSIIGNESQNMENGYSGDGIVPYSSSHLEGADSEKVIYSGHSVQETPEAIMEIRRILRVSLNEDGYTSINRP